MQKETLRQKKEKHTPQLSYSNKLLFLLLISFFCREASDVAALADVTVVLMSVALMSRTAVGPAYAEGGTASLKTSECCYDVHIYCAVGSLTDVSHGVWKQNNLLQRFLGTLIQLASVALSFPLFIFTTSIFSLSVKQMWKLVFAIKWDL